VVGQQGPELARSPREHHLQTMLARRGDRARHDLGRGVVTAHGVDGDDRPVPLGPGRLARRVLRAVVRAQASPTTWSAAAAAHGVA
jgi:hypothetical protein